MQLSALGHTLHYRSPGFQRVSKIPSEGIALMQHKGLGTQPQDSASVCRHSA